MYLTNNNLDNNDEAQWQQTIENIKMQANTIHKSATTTYNVHILFVMIIYKTAVYLTDWM